MQGLVLSSSGLLVDLCQVLGLSLHLMHLLETLSFTSLKEEKKKKWSNLKREHHLLIELHTTYKPSFHPFLAQISTELSDNRQKKMHIKVEEERATKLHKRISQTEKGEKWCRKCDRNMVLILMSDIFVTCFVNIMICMLGLFLLHFSILAKH